MHIIDYFESENQEYWKRLIKQSDWNAGQYLYELLVRGTLKELCGAETKLLLLVEDASEACSAPNDFCTLVSFCTFAPRDDIADTALTPWVGFMYTFPAFRGKRRAGKLLEYAYITAKKAGYSHLFISSGETGLYEKYGCRFYGMMKDVYGALSRVYVMDIVQKEYYGIIGSTVSGVIDRPLGSCHPRHTEMVYPINYGYVSGVFAADLAEQDVYIMGADKPLSVFTGKIIAVLHRINDIEDKWIVSVDDKNYSDDEILRAVNFTEQYFIGELYRS